VLPLLPLALVLAALVALLLAAPPVRAGSTPAADPQPAARAADGLERAVAATLYLSSADAEARFLGSAFLWGDEGLALTNAHVVGSTREVRARLSDGREILAEVVARDEGRDIAVLSVPDAGIPGLRPAPEPVLGQDVWAVGAPLGIDFTLTRGVISAFGRQTEPAVPVRLLQHDAAVNPGNSGGPLVDAQGRVLGMNSQIADGSRLYIGVAYAIPVSELERLVPALLDGTLRPVPELALAVRPVDARIAAALGLPAAAGVLVDSADLHGPAARSGLLPGDVILTAGGAALAGPGDLAFAIDGRAGDSLPLSVWREGAVIDMTLDLSPPAAGAAAIARPLRGLPVVTPSYTFAGLGVTLGPGGRVAAVTEGGPGWAAGLTAGDRILAVDGRPADPLTLAAHEIRAPVLLRVQRGGRTTHVIIDPWARGRGFRPLGGGNALDPAVVVF
jgi:serine protease Do